MQGNLYELVENVMKKHYGEMIPEHISTRIEKELSLIVLNGMEENFLRSYEVTQRLRKAHIPWIISGKDGGVSLVAYVLGITQISPLVAYNCSQKDGKRFDLEEFSTSIPCFCEWRTTARGLSVIEEVLTNIGPATPFFYYDEEDRKEVSGWVLAAKEELSDMEWAEVEYPIGSKKRAWAVRAGTRLSNAPFIRIAVRDTDSLEKLEMLESKLTVNISEMMPMGEVDTFFCYLQNFMEKHPESSLYHNISFALLYTRLMWFKRYYPKEYGGTDPDIQIEW